jgi:hypothetical protein
VAKTQIEFISPMPTEEVPVFHGAPPQCWHVILEASIEQVAPNFTAVVEGLYLPSPGIAAPLPTDVNGDGIVGDPHPGIPALQLVADDPVVVNGTPLFPGTNLASFFEMIGSEIENGGDQSTTLTWIVTQQFFFVDQNGDGGTNLTATLNGVQDKIFARHGKDPVYAPCSIPSTPTVSIFTPDWISTVDDAILGADLETAFVVGVEVRIPCRFDINTVPPTPFPLDPLPGPGAAGMAMTGNFPNIAGPGPNPFFPTLYVTFSDSYLDVTTGSFVPGGVVTGGTCATIYGVTGPNLAFAFEQSSVSAWYGIDGMINTPDDQLIYRFTMLADGQIFDTDVMPGEMLITATIETECNLFSITNVRVKHRPDVLTPNGGGPAE